MKLYIKNLSCTRCTITVKAELEKQGFHGVAVHAGELEISGVLSPDDMENLTRLIRRLGLEIIDDRESILIEKIKNSITEMIYDSSDGMKVNLSDHLSSTLGYNYRYISNVFSQVHGISIEKYVIKQKTERVKEILIHEDLSLNEIAFKMKYSSQAHLSSQFKKETGLTLKQYRQLKPGRGRENGIQ